MKKTKIIFLFGLISLIVTIRCARWVQYYSILESAPYVDYGTNMTPEIIDGQRGSAFGFGSNYVYTNSEDADTSIGAIAVSALIRKRLARIVEFGAAGSVLFKDRACFYGILDFKVAALRDPIIFSPYFGVGLGRGRESWNFDFRFATGIGYPIMKERLHIYFTPKVVLFQYVYQRYHSGIGESTSYSTSVIYGFGTGLCFSLPADQGSGFKIKPEVNFLRGDEPQLDRIDFSILQGGLQILFTF